MQVYNMEKSMSTLPLPSTPVYELTLPVSGQKIKYRPFLVKEEKVLLIANETESLEQANLAIKNVVDNCTFNKLNIDKLPLADIEYLFIMLRAKSVGEEVVGEITCSGCEAKIDYTINLEKVGVNQPNKMDPNVRISEDTVITMKYPSMTVARGLDDKEGIDMALDVTASCVEMITIGDAVHEADNLARGDIITYLENLSKKQLEMISNWMETIPVVLYEDDFKCPKCGHINPIKLEGIGSFFV